MVLAHTHTQTYTATEHYRKPRVYMDKEDVIHTHTHTQGNVTQPQKACNLAICDNMDISRVYDAKGNKADGERQILLISFICEISKTKQGNKQK